MNFPKKIKKYKTAEKLMASMLGCKEKELNEYGMGVGSFDGKVSEIPVVDAIESIKNQKIWGFTDEENVIHVWYDESVDFKMAFRFFAHESGHQNGRKYKDIDKEELKAAEYEGVALYALEQASKLKKRD